MKLVIAHDNGDREVVADNIEDYNLHEIGGDIILGAIELAVNKVKAFQAASPPEAETEGG